MKTDIWRQSARLALMLVILLGFGLRTFQLDNQELRGDETFGYYFSLPSFRTIVNQTIDLQEPHPVASYFLQSVWLDWAGHSEVALRFLSTWFGVLSIALLFRLGLALSLGVVTAVISTFLLAVNPYALWHSQDARMYSMSLALTVASSWLFVKLVFVQEGVSKRFSALHIWTIVGYLLITWLALHTHYFSVFVIIAQNLFVFLLFLCRPHSQVRPFLQWIGIQVALSLVYLPWLLVAYSTLANYHGNGDSPGVLAMLARSIRTFGFGETIGPSWVWFAATILMIGITIGLRKRSRATGFLIFYAAVPLLATWISALQRPIFDERYLVASLPPFLLLGSIALTPTWSRQQKQVSDIVIHLLQAVLLIVFLTGTLVSAQNHYTNNEYSKSIGWRMLAQTMHQFSQGVPPETARLIQTFPDPTLWYYYETMYKGQVDHLVLPPQPHDEQAALSEVVKLANDSSLGPGSVRRIVLAVQPAENWDGSGIGPRTVGHYFSPIVETTIAHWPVQVYVRPPVTMPEVNVTFENELHLSHASAEPEHLTVGGVLAVHLTWQAESKALRDWRGSEKLFLHLVGPDGQIATQKDVQIQEAFINQKDPSTHSASISYGILIPDNLTLGNYYLRAGLYDPEQAGAPRILTIDGRDAIEIATFSH